MSKLEDLAKAREKYLEVKKTFNESPILNFVRGNYKRLKKYYRYELDRINLNYD